MKVKIVAVGWILILLAITGCARFQRVDLNPAQLYQDFNSRSLDSSELKKFIENQTGQTNINWPLPGWNFQHLALAGLFYNPSMETARLEIKSAESAIITAGARPNPTISPLGGINKTSLGQDGVNPWLPALDVQIPIETANKRGFRIAVASNRVEIAKLNLHSVAWQIRSNIKSICIELLSAQSRSNILQTQIKLLEKIRSSMETQLDAGEIKASEVTPSIIAIANAEIELSDAVKQYNESLPQLATAIGVPARSVRSVNIQLGFNYNTNLLNYFLSSNAVERALKTRPDILSKLYEYEAAQAALQLEIAKQYPDIVIGPGYEWDQGEHKWRLGLTIDIPIFNRNQGPIAEARANRDLAAAKFNEVQIKAISEMEEALAAANTAIEQLKRVQALQVIKEKHLRDLEAQLKAGVIDSLVLEHARIDLISIEKPLIEAYINWEKALARLESAFYHPLESLVTK
ncbi:MAG: TolC family protein [Verrucomicrobiae bacterium]|nr:TolC family protein [Verrucomicrobiae bacterium]